MHIFMGACLFSNHYMIASLRGSDTMRCAVVARRYVNLFFPSCSMFGWKLEHYSFSMFTGNLFFPCVSAAASL